MEEDDDDIVTPPASDADPGHALADDDDDHTTPLNSEPESLDPAEMAMLLAGNDENDPGRALADDYPFDDDSAIFHTDPDPDASSSATPSGRIFRHQMHQHNSPMPL